VGRVTVAERVPENLVLAVLAETCRG
jgi:hypothetical protein